MDELKKNIRDLCLVILLLFPKLSLIFVGVMIWLWIA